VAEVPSPGVTAPSDSQVAFGPGDPFDCRKDLSSWWSSWSAAKQSWCCRFRVTCPSLEPDTTMAPPDLPPPSEPEPETRPPGLPPPDLPPPDLPPHHFGPSLFNCSGVTLAEFNTWPRAQQEWCCADMGVGCSDEQNPPAQPMSLILPEHALSAEALPAQSPAPAQSAEPPVPGAMDPQPHKHVVPETHLRGADFDESEFLPPGVEQFLQKAQRQDVAVTAQTHGFLSGAVLAAAVAVSGVAMLVVATRKVVLHRFVDGGEVRLLSRTLAMTQEPDQFADVPE